MTKEEMTENMFPNLWVRTAANHNKTLEAPHIIYVYSEKKQKTSAAKPSTFLSPPPPPSYLCLATGISHLEVVSRSHKQTDFGQSLGAY